MLKEKILFIGNSNSFSTAKHRSNALIRLGYDVLHYDPYLFIRKRPFSKYLDYFDSKTGYRFIQKLMNNWIKFILKKYTEDSFLFIWVDQGELFGCKCIANLKEKATVILYNNDDPTGKRDGRRFDQVKNSCKLYNLVVVVRNETKEDFIVLGIEKILRVYMSYDEVVHKPFADSTQIPDDYKSDITFVGTWMRNEDRDVILFKLIQAGFNVAIWGDRWQKSNYWNELKNYYKGGGICGEDYVLALQGAKISLGLLSRGNRDLHTQRSLEIPFAGGLLCGERTSEHLEMYIEGKEAVFWTGTDECIAKCKQLLEDNILREKIRLSGMKRVRENAMGNEDVCRSIIEHLKQLSYDKD